MDHLLELEDLDNLPTVDIKTNVLLPDGRVGVLWPNGHIRSAETGSWMVKPKDGAHSFTSDTGREAVSIREQIKDSAVEEALKEHGNGDLKLGIKKLVAVQVNIASKETNRRDATAALMELLKMGGFIRSKYTAETKEGGSGPESLDNEDIRIVKVLLRRAKEMIEQGEIAPDKVQKQEQSGAVFDPPLLGPDPGAGSGQ